MGVRIILTSALCLFVCAVNAQTDKGRSLFFGVNLGTKISNNEYAIRYTGAYAYNGSNQTQLEYTLLSIPQNYTTIRDILGGSDFTVPFDAYSSNIQYIPGLLTGVTIGYQVSPNLQMSIDANINRLKIRDVFSIQVYDGSVQTTENQYQLGQITAEESRFDGRYNLDYVADGNKAKFIIGGSILYSFWRMDSHAIAFRSFSAPLFSQFNVNQQQDVNITRGSGLGVGLNLGVEYRINDKIVSQIMYQPYHSNMDYGISTGQRVVLQHDFIVRFLWK